MNHTKFCIGHILIKVDNLHQAVKDFEQLGFQVTYGSALEKSTNAMIYFEDGTFIELFSTNFGQPLNSVLKLLVNIMVRMKHPYGTRLQSYLLPGEGFCDYALDCVKPSDYETNMEWLTKSEVPMFGPKHMKRKNADGILVSWSLHYPSMQRFPFFMSPYSPVIDFSLKRIHSNGALGVQKLIIMTSKWEQDLKWYQTVFQQNPEIKNNVGQIFCCFTLKGVTLVIVKGSKDEICQVVLNTEQLQNTTLRRDALYHGADILMENKELGTDKCKWSLYHVK
jgi:hypothetical protein